MSFAGVRPSTDVETKGRRRIGAALREKAVGEDVEGQPLFPIKAKQILARCGKRCRPANVLLPQYLFQLRLR